MVGSITENQILLVPAVIDRVRIFLSAIPSHLSNTTLCRRIADCFEVPKNIWKHGKNAWRSP